MLIRVKLPYNYIIIRIMRFKQPDRTLGLSPPSKLFERCNDFFHDYISLIFIGFSWIRIEYDELVSPGIYLLIWNSRG